MLDDAINMVMDEIIVSADWIITLRISFKRAVSSPSALKSALTRFSPRSVLSTFG
ncbi:hypothetical protein D3C81_2049950 [compost metagenome]